MRRSFDVWMKKVDKIAEKAGYERSSFGFNDQLDYWKRLFKRGFTPQQAWDRT